MSSIQWLLGLLSLSRVLRLPKNVKPIQNYRRKITKKPEEIVNFNFNGKTGAIGYNMIKREE